MRSKQIDSLRGIGIFLVVLGHTQNLFTDWIFTFHMPLFFFLSGFLRYGSTEKPWPEFLKAKIHSLLFPYVAFWLVDMILCFILPLLTGRELFCFGWPQIEGLLLGGRYLSDTSNNFPIWYLQLMFLVSIAFEGILRLKLKGAFLSIGVVLTLITIPFQTLLPGRPAFHINILPAALVFMMLGYWSRNFLNNRVPLRPFVSFLLGIILIACGALISFPYDTNVSDIRRLTYFPGALCTVWGLYLLCCLLQHIPLLCYLGNNSLYILGLHSLFWDPAYAFASQICTALPIHSSTLETLLAVIVGITLSCILKELWHLLKILLHRLTILFNT